MEWEARARGRAMTCPRPHTQSSTSHLSPWAGLHVWLPSHRCAGALTPEGVLPVSAPPIRCTKDVAVTAFRMGSPAPQCPPHAFGNGGGVYKGTQGGSEAGLARGTSPVSGRMSLSVVCPSVEGQREGVGRESPCLPSRGEPIWVLRQRPVCLDLGRRNALWRLEVSPPAGMLSPAVPPWTSGLETPFLPSV